MKNLNLRLIFSAVGMALSIAVVVMLVILEDPNLKAMMLLLALGSAAQALAIFDQMGQSKEEKRDE